LLNTSLQFVNLAVTTKILNRFLEGLVRAGFSHDVIISTQGLDKRFTRMAAEFVKRVLEEALEQVIKASAEVEVEILQRFSYIYVADGSVITYAP
jgi:hypothetical protein